MKKWIVTALCVGFTLITYSQQKENTAPGAFRPAWYVGANGGYNIFLGEGNNFFNEDKPHIFTLKDNGSYLGRFVLGYDFTPAIGIRGMLGYVNTNWPNAFLTDKYNFSTEMLSADFMLNLSNLNNHFDPNRKLDFLAFAGLGMGYRDQNLIQNLSPITGIVRLGLESDFKLSQDWKLNLILEGNVATDNYNDLALSPLPFDLIGALTVGVTYRLPEPAPQIAKVAVSKQPVLETKPQPDNSPAIAAVPTPAPVVPAPTPVPAPDTAVVPAPQPVTVPTVVPQPQPEPKAVASTIFRPAKLWINIFYPISRVGIHTTRQNNAIAKVVEFLNAYPDSKIVISGYADRGTGTAAVNKNTSKKRAQNVTKLLTTKYAINASRIKTTWYGDRVQPYKQVSMNRLTTIKSVAEPVVCKQMSDSAKSTATDCKLQKGCCMSTDLSEIITFGENKSALKTKKQTDAIMKIALYLRRNPNAKVIIKGYADKKSSAEVSNKSVSEKRAVGVANSLILKYSIDQSRIQIKWFGTGKQSYPKQHNRVVVIETVK